MYDVVTFSDKLIIPDGKILRVNFIDRNIERINRVAEYVEELDEKCEFEKVFSDTFIYELLPLNATKGNALNILCKQFITKKTVVAAGDWHNDMSILSVSDIPVCPQNAADEHRQLCGAPQE